MGDGVNIAARLEGICEPGAICLSEDAYRQVKGRLGLAVSDLGPTQLKNIAEPMRIYSLPVGKPAQATPIKPGVLKRPLAMLVAGAVALIVIAAGAGYFLSANRTATAVPTAATPAAPARLSIVVLPFANLSNDPNQDYFADGITENLTTDLSRIHNSFVIARNTAFSFKGKNVDARDIGRELGVRLCAGGLGPARPEPGPRQRPTHRCGLRRASLGGRFEEDVADLFKLQDQVVARLTNSLGYELVRTERKRTPVPKARTLSISPCAGGPWCGRNRSSSGRRRTTKRLKRCSNRSLRSTRMKPKRWRAMLTPICWNTRADGQPPGPITRQTYSVRPTGPSRSSPIICGRIM